MQTKLLNIKDTGTYITVLATKTSSDNETEQIYLKRAGLGFDLIAITQLETMQTETDPYKWFDATMKTAHEFIQKNFDKLNTGWEIDVEQWRKEIYENK